MALAITWSDIVAGLGVNGFVGGASARSADMNQYVLQNLLWLKGRPFTISQDFDGTVFSTSSTSFQDTGKSASYTPTGGRVLIVAFGHTSTQTSGVGQVLTLYEDGVNLGDPTHGMLVAQPYLSGIDAKAPFCIAYVTPTAPSIAAHNWVLMMRATGVATINLRSAQMWAIEIGA